MSLLGLQEVSTSYGMRAKGGAWVGLAISEELGPADRAARFPDELSGGERPRAVVAGAVAGEPSGALDCENGEAVVQMILTGCRRGAAAVVVTRGARVASWADGVVFSRDGTITNGTVPRAGRRPAAAVRVASVTTTSVVHPPPTRLTASQCGCHHRQLASARLTELAALVNPEGAPKQ